MFFLNRDSCILLRIRLGDLQGVPRNRQLLNSLECLLPYIILDIKDFFACYFVKNIFLSNIFYFEINFTII